VTDHEPRIRSALADRGALGGHATAVSTASATLGTTVALVARARIRRAGVRLGRPQRAKELRDDPAFLELVREARSLRREKRWGWIRVAGELRLIDAHADDGYEPISDRAVGQRLKHYVDALEELERAP